MIEGFFPTDPPSSRNIPLLFPRCESCGLYRSCKSPKMEVNGKGKRKILIVGEAPGKNEDEQGIPFIGESGEVLETVLSKLGVDMRKDCWITNSLICRPWGIRKKAGQKTGTVINRTPTEKEIDYCRPNLVKTIKELNPEIIIPLGATAIKILIGWLWNNDVGKIGRWVGWKIPCQELNAWICPNWHPAHILYNRKKIKDRYGDRDFNKDPEPLDKLFVKYLKEAVELRGRPWKQVPDYSKQIKVEMDPNKAAVYLKMMALQNHPISFDFETDRLKPDHKESTIVCASISDGDCAIAFPWHGEIVNHFKEFLRSPTPKVGFNLKFEHRWVRRLYGCNVRNWVWDGMLAAHVIDNRSSVCSLNFQSFVLLGIGKDEYASSFFDADGSNAKNNIGKADLQRIMKYCAMDSLLEYKVAMKQMELMGVTNVSNNMGSI